MDIKCIFIDVDGTLLNDSKQVSDYTKKILNNIKSKGVLLILASGRDLFDVQKISKESQLSPIVISNNGAVIYDYQQNILLFSSTFKKKEIKEIWNISTKYRTDIIFNSKECRYRHYINLDKKYNESRDLIIDSYKEITTDIYQIVLLSENNNNFKQCINEILFLNTKKSNCGRGKNGIYFADINKSDISKGTGVTKLLEKLNIPKENTMCFGDSYNDIEMFSACATKVAMKNSCNEIKSIANYVTDFDNNNDGLAKYLEKNLNCQIVLVNNKF